MKILLTAPPAMGKSTVIGKVVGAFKGTKRGIVAREIRDDDGERVGFTSVKESGDSRQFMFRTKTPNEDSIGGLFDVDLEAVDGFVIPELKEGMQAACGLLYVDEIGRAQAKSALFLATLREILAGRSNVLASIVYEDEPWSLEFKRHPDVCILEVTPGNRDRLPEILGAAFGQAALFAALSKSQKSQVLRWLKEFVQSEKLDSAAKIFSNALPYLHEKKIELVASSNGRIEYSVRGLTNAHRLVLEGDKFVCDCDLSKGTGIFAGNAGVCSHEMSARLMAMTP
ncbi:MAG TPA: nucleoside-triphosphatase [Oculatellaceae cyanobacterium]